MSIDEQIKIMEKQLENFDDLVSKMAYMNFAFDKDSEYTKEARDIVRSNVCRELDL